MSARFFFVVRGCVLVLMARARGLLPLFICLLINTCLSFFSFFSFFPFYSSSLSLLLSLLSLSYVEIFSSVLMYPKHALRCLSNSHSVNINGHIAAAAVCAFATAAALAFLKSRVGRDSLDRLKYETFLCLFAVLLLPPLTWIAATSIECQTDTSLLAEEGSSFRVDDGSDCGSTHQTAFLAVGFLLMGSSAGPLLVKLAVSDERQNHSDGKCWFGPSLLHLSYFISQSHVFLFFSVLVLSLPHLLLLFSSSSSSSSSPHP